jgi:hypothetical protein
VLPIGRDDLRLVLVGEVLRVVDCRIDNGAVGVLVLEPLLEKRPRGQLGMRAQVFTTLTLIRFGSAAGQPLINFWFITKVRFQ